jgi:hypothetical protein
MDRALWRGWDGEEVIKTGKRMRFLDLIWGKDKWRAFGREDDIIRGIEIVSRV